MIGAAGSLPPSLPLSTPATATGTEASAQSLINVDSRAALLAAAAEGKVAGGGRPPTAPTHGPGRRAGARPLSATMPALRSQGSTKQLVSMGSTNKVRGGPEHLHCGIKMQLCVDVTLLYDLTKKNEELHEWYRAQPNVCVSVYFLSTIMVDDVLSRYVVANMPS